MATSPEQAEHSDNVLVPLHNVCRTCLAKEKELHPICEKSNFNITYNLMITAITGIKVLENDGLPLLICDTCKQTVSHAYQFKQQSEKADLTLRNMIFKKNHNILKHEDPIMHSEVKIKIEECDWSNDDEFKVAFDFGSSGESCDDENKTKVPRCKEEITSQHVCARCNTTYSSELELQTHQDYCLKVEYEEEKSSFCPLCTERFVDAQALLRHVRAKHNEVMQHKKAGPRQAVNTVDKEKSKVKKKKKTASKKDKATSASLKYKHRIKTSSGNVINLKIVNKMDLSHKKSAPVTEDQLKPLCGICSLGFGMRKELDAHLKVHYDTEVLCCQLCDRSFLELVYFKRHLSTHHTDTTFKNGDVDTLPDQYIKFTIEEMIMKSTSPDVCPQEKATFVQVCCLCGRLFLSLQELMKHNDAEHPDYPYRCNLCVQIFTTTQSAERHRKFCKLSQCRYECDACGKKFSHEKLLNKHILSSHKGDDVSLDVTNKNELLEKHARVHNPSLYECDHCHKKFKRRDNFQIHLRVHEKTNRVRKQYKPRDRPKAPPSGYSTLCLYCGRSISSASNMAVHLRRHTGEKPYKCDLCQKGFPRSFDLQCHRMTHTGEKRCFCTVCGRGFLRSHGLIRHMRIHTGQKPYKCTYCEKSFAQTNDLTLHVRRHTGEKPYVCEICDERFIQKKALQNHWKAYDHFPTTDSQKTELLCSQQSVTSTVRTRRKRTEKSPNEIKKP